MNNPNSQTVKWKFTTRNEVEEVRDALKIYFPNNSSDRAAFNTICDMAVKGLKRQSGPADEGDWDRLHRLLTEVRVTVDALENAAPQVPSTDARTAAIGTAESERGAPPARAASEAGADEGK